MAVSKFMKTLFPFLILGTIGIFTLGHVMTQWSNNQRIYIKGEIVILKDEDFKKRYNFQGSGTSDDPYLIENLELSTTKTWGIAIFDTTKYFVIKNCSLSASYNCIYLNSVAQRTALIENNNCSISIGFVSRSYYFYEYYRTPTSCISIINSVGSVVRENYCKSNLTAGVGIHLWMADYTIVLDNTCIESSGGITVDISRNVIIENNYCANSGNGITINHSFDVYILNNLVWNNSNSGIALYDQCFNIVIKNNTCQRNFYGINIETRLYFSESEIYPSIFRPSVISNNIVENNTDSGIALTYASSYKIYKNHIRYQRTGFLITSAAHCRIYQNIIESNIDYGIHFIDGYYTNIYENNFLKNNLNGTAYGSKQAYEYTINNRDVYWYNHTSHKGNFWSDIIWNEGVVYQIDGNKSDLYPLENPINL